MRKRTLITVAGVLVASALLMYGGLRLAKRMASAPARIARQAVEKRENVVDLASVVQQIRGLDRLETISLRVIHVSHAEQSYGLIPNALTGDEITFFAVGDVIGGVDLSRLTPGDLRLDSDGAVRVTLPPAEILVTRLDNRQSRVLDRKTGVMRKADSGLEGRIREAAERSIREDAIAKGILPGAEKNAQKAIADLLHSVGFSKVRFTESSPRRDL
ncbi:MAG: DUF4230 domain-containing protein [Thermoanaerobaculia bacterium]